MRILVIDDRHENRASAEELKAQHDVTIVGSTVEAAKQIASGQYDVVLTDLFMPADKTPAFEGATFSYPFGKEQGTLVNFSKSWVGQDLPVGFSFAIRATLEGAKYVAIVTRDNHHGDPISAQLDWFGRGREFGKPSRRMDLNGSIFMIIRALPRIRDSKILDDKDWAAALEDLLTDP
ncbi:MAG: hypothetical protein A3C80_01315 [Candidatus Ryanbacteria bacterium RIFCSPHIGHO2_02_FULL_45_43]|uniref:Response regulatory domain-containing protein n=1 Tax=Candidatus Ryanbacteria bacterium RIFCSPHIGHO2_01_45_13 TaxID=1802112 RepID=A0A1G2G2R4_9BACT|nr:MAG: hypothetical protein A2718_04230 [Candidatus Ryanbacteria bacterium RIFCSPHIGHO2_01_FULL_44_130]OGZ44098.1 MAG: hypothetical protein A2W41_00110 [Candidatus Ryanbacteria bacterium RIFCSPHIGHO2_01_45_13]OGZ48897.1 MAG: hypothetical protein A3C80_01315 [Candidatus Ryanbacteria bacterium RIFCSPHIGHO2_02_FULL_45_43]OGZ50942.1 MAG: hypothetical protein A3E55_02850 [Candidatus Ryanbacteria bacterium RIFCSPHIGHO2_12_FULL_44_20]OGZ51780.1 MAG: hypothetical protein A3A17_02265 [Candidatus Ryanba